jgi:D-erythrulose 1-phosphate 3-epimerase
MADYSLGINLIGFGNRFPEPEVWVRLVREEFGLDYVQFSTDLVDPLWPRPIVDEYIENTRKYLQKYKIQVHSAFFGVFTRRNLLMHPDRKTRMMWFDWYKAFIRLSADVGARAAGSPFGAISVNDASDPIRREERITEAIKLWQELTYYARECKLDYLYFETMSTDREIPDTVESTLELYHRMNENAGVPTYVCQDIGHAPHPCERDRYYWLRELAQVTRIVHLQQSDENNSRHWPFTPEYNKVGAVEPAKTIETIDATGVKNMFLALEIFHRESAEQEPRVIPEIKQSVAYWRKYLGNKEVHPF